MKNPARTNAPRSAWRIALAACGALLLFLAEAGAGQIDLRLDVSYAGADPDAGGVWQLFARSDEQGIFSLRSPLVGIGSAVTSELPVGRVNGSATNNAGFSLFVNQPSGFERDLFFGQTLTPSGQGQQGLFYGVGTLSNGSPDFPGQPGGTNSIGPNLTTLTGVQNVPWANEDPLWATGVTVASGAFSAGFDPGFGSGAFEGSLLTSIGSATSPGSRSSDVTFTTLVVTNLSQTLPADFNGDGVVDLLDLDTLGQNFGAGPGATRSQGDANGDGFVDLLDLDLLGQDFGLGGGSDSVPEPSSCGLLVAGLLAARFGGRRRPR